MGPALWRRGGDLGDDDNDVDTDETGGRNAFAAPRFSLVALPSQAPAFPVDLRGQARPVRAVSFRSSRSSSFAL